MRSAGAGSFKCIWRDAMSFSLSVSVSVSRLEVACGALNTSARPSSVASRQLMIFAASVSSSSVLWQGGENLRIFETIDCSCVEKPGSRSGWKYLSNMFSTNQCEMKARPTAVISCLPVSTAVLLTTTCNHCGMVFQSLRMEKDSCAINPSNRLKRVAYSLSSQDVRESDKR